MIKWRYVAVLTLSYFSLGLLIPVLSLMLMDKGVSLGGLALAMGVYSLTAVLLELPSGIAADMLGRKRTFLLSLLVSCAAFVLPLFVSGTAWIFVVMVLAGAGRAMSSGTVEALFVSRHNAAYGMDSLPKAMRALALTESAGAATGALLGGFLPNIRAALLPAMGTYDLNLALRVALGLLLLVLTVIWIPSDNREGQAHVRLREHLRESVRTVRVSHALKWVLLATVGLGVALSALEAYWQPHFLGLLGGEDRAGLLGLLSTLYFGAVTAGNLLSERLLSKHRVGEKVMYLAGRAAMIACMAGVALAASPALFMALYCPMYFCLGASNISEGSLLHREVPDESRASLLSTQSLSLQSGSIAVAIGGGAIVVGSSIQTLWLIAAAASLLLLAPALRIVRRRRPEGEAAAADGGAQAEQGIN